MTKMANKQIAIKENEFHMLLEVEENGEIRFLHFGQQPYEEGSILEEDKVGFRLVEMELAGFDRPLERHGSKNAVTSAGCHMVYKSH